MENLIKYLENRIGELNKSRRDCRKKIRLADPRSHVYKQMLEREVKEHGILIRELSKVLAQTSPPAAGQEKPSPKEYCPCCNCPDCNNKTLIG